MSWRNLARNAFEDGYRGLGVRKFYETKLSARKEHVREIRRRIESEVFEEWKNGVKSMLRPFSPDQRTGRRSRRARKERR